MGQRSTVLYTTGAAGTGKTIRRGPWFVTKEFLPGSADGVHVSTFPWRYDPWVDNSGVQREGLCAYLARTKGMSDEDVRRRVVCIPESVSQTWRNDGWDEGDDIRGPWDFFENEDLSGWHIAIDEIHNYCPKQGIGSKRIQARWSRWLGELRHRGATIEFISQAPAKVAPCIANEAEIRLELLGKAQEYDPFLGIKFYYWYQLAAKLGGMYRPCVWQIELRQSGQTWKEQSRSPFWLDDEMFALYDTWSSPIAGGGAGTQGQHPYQSKSWPGLLAWFAWSNGFQLTWRFLLVVLVFAALWFRQELMDGYFYVFTRMLPGNKAAAAEVEPAPSSPELKRAAAEIVGDGERVERLVERVAALEDQLSMQSMELQASTARVEFLESRVGDAFAVASITKDAVTFRGGYTYRIGEAIDFGPYEGVSLEGVDYVRRVVHLSDGRQLRMGIGGGDGGLGQWLQDPAEAASAAAGQVRGSLPSVGDASEPVAVPRPSGAENHGQRSPTTALPIRAVARERDGSVLRRGSEFGREAGDAGSDGTIRR